MVYRPDLIALSSEPRFATPMYSLVLLKAAPICCSRGFPLRRLL